MLHITCVDETVALNHDLILQREVRGYLCACRAECDDEDNLEFDFVVLDQEELPTLAGLGEPEETARIEIRTGDQVRVIMRLVYVSTVYFAPFDINDLTEVLHGQADQAG
ncbi:MAG: hypothetical protein FDZ69_00090 [Deltaproteobacteria bacterium]|nr:MAG: hypothetical protein FDZ69_00090 [Deltaproteobacteria bacterium]